jgi:hypothetical protein
VLKNVLENSHLKDRVGDGEDNVKMDFREISCEDVIYMEVVRTEFSGEL